MPTARAWLLATSVSDVRDVGVEVHREAVDMTGAHDEGMVAHQILQIVDLAVICAVGWVGADDLGLLPGALEIVLHDGATLALGAEGEGAVDMVFRVGWQAIYEAALNGGGT